jgi:hypothetical protein
MPAVSVSTPPAKNSQNSRGNHGRCLATSCARLEIAGGTAGDVSLQYDGHRREQLTSVALPAFLARGLPRRESRSVGKA